jgi:type 1 glutamine amidotransferase
VVFRSWLYKSQPLASDAVPLLVGFAEAGKSEPVAWIRDKTANRGRVFYTCLGHKDDFQQAAFTKLLRNGVLWATNTLAK